MEKGWNNTYSLPFMQQKITPMLISDQETYNKWKSPLRTILSGPTAKQSDSTVVYQNYITVPW